MLNNNLLQQKKSISVSLDGQFLTQYFYRSASLLKPIAIGKENVYFLY